MARIHLVTDINAPPEICFDAARDVTVHLASWPAHSAVAGVTAGPLGWMVDRIVLERFMTKLLLQHNIHVVRAAEAGVATRAEH